MDLFRKKAVNTFVPNQACLAQCLSAFDLVFLGIGAVIGRKLQTSGELGVVAGKDPPHPAQISQLAVVITKKLFLVGHEFPRKTLQCNVSTPGFFIFPCLSVGQSRALIQPVFETRSNQIRKLSSNERFALIRAIRGQGPCFSDHRDYARSPASPDLGFGVAQNHLSPSD